MSKFQAIHNHLNYLYRQNTITHKAKSKGQEILARLDGLIFELDSMTFEGYHEDEDVYQVKMVGELGSRPITFYVDEDGEVEIWDGATYVGDSFDLLIAHIMLD